MTVFDGVDKSSLFSGAVKLENEMKLLSSKLFKYFMAPQKCTRSNQILTMSVGRSPWFVVVACFVLWLDEVLAEGGILLLFRSAAFVISGYSEVLSVQIV